MKKNCWNNLGKCGDTYYTIFRVVIGLLFLVHGIMKFSGGAPASGLMWAAALAEIAAGAFVLLGLWSRLGGLIGAVTMLVAYIFHATAMFSGWAGLNPMSNGGEMAVLYLVAFLVVMKEGNGKLSLEQKLTGKEQF